MDNMTKTHVKVEGCRGNEYSKDAGAARDGACRQFYACAERLSYSQSGVSRMVGDLETDWGFKVLDRSRKGVVLSADGRQVMPAVEALCEEFGRLQRHVDEMRGLMRGKICIGTFSSVATQYCRR